MKLYHKISALLMSGLMFAGGFVLTGCDNDELNTNPYNKSGVNLLGFGPCPLKRLDNMRIIGTRLNLVSKVLFPQGNSLLVEPKDYEEATFRLISNEEMEVVVPDMTVPGKLRLVVGNDTIVSASKITFEEDITVTGVTPVSNLRAGDVITISGEFVWNIASVTFNDHVVVDAEDFLVNTRKEIKVAVPMEAQSGDVVFSNGGEPPMEVAWPEPLEIRQAMVTSLSSESLEFGETVTIVGTDLDLVAAVIFPLVKDGTAFTVNEDGTQLNVVVPSNTIPGVITLVQHSGLTVESPAYTLPMAEYTDISPVEELNEGDVVIINGNNLDRITSLVLPGDITLKEGEFTKSTAHIQFVVPKDMGDGKVVMVQHENYSVETDKIAMHHEGTEEIIWSGTWACSGWVGNQDLAWGGFDWSTLKEGQEIIFYVEFIDPTAKWACIAPRVGDGWANLPSISQIELVPSAETQRVSFKPTAADIEALQTKNGLVITGNGFILKQVALSSLETVIWQGAFSVSSWNALDALAWGGYDFSTVQAGQTLTIYYTLDEASTYWQMRVSKGSDWSALKGTEDPYDLAGTDHLAVKLTQDMLNELQNDGGLILTGHGCNLIKVTLQ